MIGGSVVLRNPPVEYSSVIHQGVPLSGTSTCDMFSEPLSLGLGFVGEGFGV